MDDIRTAGSSREGKGASQIIKIEEERLHQHLGEIVRGNEKILERMTRF